MTDLSVQLQPTLDFLVGLLNTHSPIGYHVEAVEYCRRAFAALNIPGLEIGTTGKGALLLHWPGTHNTAPRGVTAHIDTLGLLIKEIKPNGRLRTTHLGGPLWQSVAFDAVTVRTFDNRRFRGTAVMVNPSVHVNPVIRTTLPDENTLEIRLDVRVNSAADVRALGIEVGDFIFLDPRVEVLPTGFIRSRFLDDKAGVACIYAALLALRDAQAVPAQDTAFLISNYEEHGHGGAAGWPYPLAELLAIDMGAIGDTQNSDEFSACICVKDSSGPYHIDMIRKLKRLAAAHDIPHKMDIYPFYGSDGSAWWRAGGDGRVGLLGPGIDASHAYERTHTDSLVHTSHLMARYLLDLEA